MSLYGTKVETSGFGALRFEWIFAIHPDLQMAPEAGRNAPTQKQYARPSRPSRQGCVAWQNQGRVD